jgi:hypothetical protein
MATEFTREWLSDFQNKIIVANATIMADKFREMERLPPHPYFFFQEIAWDSLYSTLALIEQGWTREAIEEYLAGDSIFSLNGIDLFLVGAVNEVLLVMPDGPVRQEITIHKLCQ